MFQLPKSFFRSLLLAFCTVTTPALATTSIEFYNAGINHYFMTASSDEAIALDNKPSWGWVRTGKTFDVWLTQASAPSGAAPVCRFFGVFANGTVGSHFYTVDPGECEYVKGRLDWGWGYEGDAFYAVKPTGGSCPSGTSPIYRAFNDGMGGAPNHRYMASLADVSTMVSQGWSNEGIVMCAPSGGSPGTPTPTHLNDTGITANQCYQAGSNVLVACNSAGAIALNNAQDGMAGRDANVATNGNTDGKLGFSFASVTGGCVQDNVTGLMWEVKTADGGLRDWNRRYTNYSADYNPSGKYGTPTDASGFVTAVNATNLCGHNDWRLPSADELHSIVDYGVAYPGPTVDATWFPNTQRGEEFWSASPYLSSSSDFPYYGSSKYAWYAFFHNGSVLFEARSNKYSVRLVRAGQSQIQTRYTVSADGQEVTDNQTKLIWRRCAEDMVFSGGTCTGTPGTFNYEAALRRAAAQAGSTGIAWRLPNIKELASIADRSRYSPAIDPTAFPATPYLFFWSASPAVTDYYFEDLAWVAYFSHGPVDASDRTTSSGYVRLVRDGQ